LKLDVGIVETLKTQDFTNMYIIILKQPFERNFFFLYNNTKHKQTCCLHFVLHFKTNKNSNKTKFKSLRHLTT